MFESLLALKEPEEPPQLIKCSYCGDDIAEGDECRATNDESTLCPECFTELFASCDNCEEIVDRGEMVRIRSGNDLCEDCISNHAFNCERCNDYEHTDNGYEVVGNHGSEYWCDYCYEYHSSYCEECDSNHPYGENICMRNERIHQYSYRPYPLQFRYTGQDGRVYSNDAREPKNTLHDRPEAFMGFEVEVEAAQGSLSKGSECFDGIDEFYLKTDGSLNHGFEIVSHPATLDYYYQQAERLMKPFSELGSLGFRAWRTSTCGMHVHVSRKAFGNKAHLWRFAWLFNCNPSQFERLAGRSSSYASFDGQKHAASQWIAGKTHWEPARYTAVNLSNRDTVEIRIFRSSLLPRRIIANLGFVDCAVEFTRTLTVKDINDMGNDLFNAFVRFIMSRTEPQYEATKHYTMKYFGGILQDDPTAINDSDY